MSTEERVKMVAKVSKEGPGVYVCQRIERVEFCKNMCTDVPLDRRQRVRYYSISWKLVNIWGYVFLKYTQCCCMGE